MNTLLTTLVLVAAVVAPANGYDAKTRSHLETQRRLSTEQYPGGPTLGKCLAAIDDARRHGDEWRADFSIKECADIAGKAIDNGLLLLDDAAEPD